MKTKKLGFMNVKEDVLSRDEMKNILAGSGNGCRVAWRNSDGSWAGYSSCTSMSPSQIDDHYNSGYTNGSGQYVSGYCCASCGSGNFSNASPCP